MVLFKFNWRLQNFSYFWEKEKRVEIYSPEFLMTAIRQTKWRILITDEKPIGIDSRRIPTGMKFIKLYLVRTEDDGLSSLHLHTEIELLKADDSLFCPFKFGISNTHFKGNKSCILHENISFDKSIAEIVPEDILTVKCKIYSTSTSFLERGECFAETRASVESTKFVAVVEGVSKLEHCEKLSAKIQPASAHGPLFTAHMYQANKGQLILFMKSESVAHIGFCRVFILTNICKPEECGQYTSWRECRNDCAVTLTVSFKQLMGDYLFYLRNDVITLKCEVTFYSTPETPERIDDISCKDFPEKKNNPQISLSSLAEDLLNLREEGTLCDVKLRAKTNTFPAHKSVLSARSPVFKKMLGSDKKEGTGDCINIPDMNPDTLKNLLTFMYTDTTVFLTWRDAVELYSAAEAYQIEYLKVKCVSYLKSNIQVSNCCDLLLLSDKHSDRDLKVFVKQYIFRRQQEVLSSPEFKAFKDNHANLVIETMLQ